MVWLDLGQGEEGDQVGRLVGARWHGALNALGRTRKGIWNRVQRVELRLASWQSDLWGEKTIGISHLQRSRNLASLIPEHAQVVGKWTMLSTLFESTLVPSLSGALLSLFSFPCPRPAERPNERDHTQFIRKMSNLTHFKETQN